MEEQKQNKSDPTTDEELLDANQRWLEDFVNSGGRQGFMESVVARMQRNKDLPSGIGSLPGVGMLGSAVAQQQWMKDLQGGLDKKGWMESVVARAQRNKDLLGGVGSVLPGAGMVGAAVAQQQWMKDLLGGLDRQSWMDSAVARMQRNKDLLRGVGSVLPGAGMVGPAIAQQQWMKDLLGGSDRQSWMDSAVARMQRNKDLLKGVGSVLPGAGRVGSAVAQQQWMKDLLGSTAGQAVDSVFARQKSFTALLQGAAPLSQGAMSSILGSQAFQALVASGSEALDSISHHAFEARSPSGPPSAPLAEIEAELVSVLTTDGSVSSLSSPSKVMLWWLVFAFCSLLNYLALQNAVREELCFITSKLPTELVGGQVGKAIRSAMCTVPLDALKGYRYVTGTGVRLRAGPGTKSEVLPVVIPIGAALEVLDTEGRSWLYVSVLGQEGVEGWISKKYTQRLVD